MLHASPLPSGATEKKCSKCGEVKPLTEFYERKGSNTRGYTSQCKACDRVRSAKRRQDPATIAYHQAYQPAWRAENRDKVNEYTKAWRGRNPRTLSMLKRKWRYGLAAEQFNELLETQGYKCRICCEPFDPTAGINAIHVDHDHDTGQVRGLLCGRCNRGIGQFKDDAELLRAAAAYLDDARLQMKTWSELGSNAERLAEQETTSPAA